MSFYKIKKSRRSKAIISIGVGMFLFRIGMFIWTLDIVLNSFTYSDGSYWKWNSSDGVSRQQNYGKFVSSHVPMIKTGTHVL